MKRLEVIATAVNGNYRVESFIKKLKKESSSKPYKKIPSELSGLDKRYYESTLEQITKAQKRVNALVKADDVDGILALADTITTKVKIV